MSQIKKKCVFKGTLITTPITRCFFKKNWKKWQKEEDVAIMLKHVITNIVKTQKEHVALLEKLLQKNYKEVASGENMENMEKENIVANLKLFVLELNAEK